ncbi:hypothetical protein [Halocatena marina]|uniref:Uncharacterized protein n=1 Tax=Halocatena marina TaxID=2934937 RepID=A0ABD5YW53_9EURY|nr:hypothetical protein [Halocatena marina]
MIQKGPKSDSESWFRRWLLRPDILVIFLLLIVPFGLAAAIESSITSLLAVPGYFVLIGFTAITTPMLPSGFLGTPWFFALSGVWFYFIAALTATILRHLWRLLS